MHLQLLWALSLRLASSAHVLPGENQTHPEFLGTCYKIEAVISSASQVFFPPAQQYVADISHSALSSTRDAACSVEPGSAEDVSKILKIISSCRTPFAVKGGGHATNPGFSSTLGVQIAMSRFNDTKVNPDDGTVEVGAGLTWDQVYEALGPTGVNVVGGRIPGVGVAGLTLGGGYSYKSNEYGLSLDNVAGYELVLPNGTIKSVTAKDKDLWFGLRGGGNNFGIVTKFILTSHPQIDIWGGMLVYTGDKLDQIKEALIKFQQNKDTKAAMWMILYYMSQQTKIVAYYCYDAPTLPPGVFDDFMAIQPAQGNVTTRSYSDLILSLGANTNGTRYFLNSAPVIQYSPAVFDAFVNFTLFWGKRVSALDETAFVGAALEPFDSGLFSHGSPSAYPPDRSQAILPSSLNIAWSDPSLDETMAHVARDGARTIRSAAIADGQNVSHAAMYSNYALFGTPLEEMYGENVPRLRKTKGEIDPDRVMDLAGGFKF